MKKYYVYIQKPDAGAAIYGGGWTKEDAAYDCAGDCGKIMGDLVAVPEELGVRIEAEGSTPELHAEAWEKGVHVNH